MDDDLSRDTQRRLEEFLDGIGRLLGSEHARGSFAMYAQGLLGDAERKSVEPIAARACIDPKRVDACHQRLLHFLNNVPWDDRAVRRFAVQHAVAAISERRPIETWIVDDTGFIKQGKHSVGVQRQYSGSAGKVVNCQVGVSLSVANGSDHLPIDFELYLPESWADDPERRAEARIPDSVRFATKPEIALSMIRRAVDDGVAPGVVLADCAYGNISTFRAGVRALGLHYAVGVDAPTKVYRLDAKGSPSGRAIDVRAIAAVHAVSKGDFHRVTWRQGTAHRLSGRFSCERVVPSHRDGTSLDEREPVWLVCEWLDGQPHPNRYYFISLPSLKSRRDTVRLLKERWRTERIYEDLKGELGFDHFEGRRFAGWHHHVTVSLCCYAFLVAERSRAFPPSAECAACNHAITVAA